MCRTLRRAWHLPGTNAQSRHTSNEPAREETDQLRCQFIGDAIDDDTAPSFKSAQARDDDLLRIAPAAKRCRLSGDIEKGRLGRTRAKSEYAQATSAVLLG
jgi:hypothetical protein